MGNKPYILWFDEIGLNDLPMVGGKNASLGEMRRELSKSGVNVPNGFAVTGVIGKSRCFSSPATKLINKQQ